MTDEHRLIEAELNQYQADGFFVRTGVFTQAEIMSLLEAVDRAEARAQSFQTEGRTYYLDGKRFVDHEGCTLQYEHQRGSEQLRVVEPIHVLDPELDNLVDDPRLTQPMQTLVGSDALSLWTGKLNLKAPGGTGFGWHQDSPYWVHDCKHVDQLPNVMLTLDAQTPENGCFQVIRGSHKQGILPGCNDGSQLGGFFTDPERFDAQQAVSMHVPAGSLIFFNPHTVHGSRPNGSKQGRPALIYTYQPASFPLLKMLKTGQIRNVRCG